MLPDLIEIVPPARPKASTVVLPGSKSLTNRALIAAALARGRVVLRGALWSEDTQAMVDCLERLGFEVQVANDPASEKAGSAKHGHNLAHGGTHLPGSGVARPEHTLQPTRTQDARQRRS